MADVLAYIAQVWTGFLAQDPLTQVTTLATLYVVPIGLIGLLHRSMISSKQEVIDAKVRLAEVQDKRIKKLETDNAALLREAPRGWLERAAYERRDGNEIKAITVLRLGLESAAPDLAACCLDLAGHHLGFLDHKLPAHLPEAERHAKLAILLAPDDRRARAMLEEIIEIKAAMGGTAEDSAGDDVNAEDFLEPEPGADAETTVYELCQASYSAFLAGRYSLAERLARRAMLIGKRHLGEIAPPTLKAQYHHAQALRFAGEALETLAKIEALLQVQDMEHSDTLYTRTLRAYVLNDLKRHEEALAEVETLLLMWEQEPDVERSDILATCSLHAQVLNDLGRHKEALAEVETLLPVWEREYDLKHPDALATRSLHVQVLNDLRRYKEALAEVETLLPVWEREYDVEHPGALHTHWLYGLILSNLDRSNEALDVLKALLSKIKNKLSKEHYLAWRVQELIRALKGKTTVV